MRGTAKNQVGCTDASESAILRGSEMVTETPRCTAGSSSATLGDVGRGQPRDHLGAPFGEVDDLLDPFVRVIRFRWVSCTPLGGPVVPDV